LFIGKFIVTLQPFIISLNGLAHGRSEFSYRVGKEFFGAFGNSEISDADVAVEVAVDKANGFIGVDCSISGTVTLPCDRCLEPLTLPVDALAQLSVKFGPQPAEAPLPMEGEREILCLSDADTDLDLSQTVYDYALLSLPMQKVHAEGECNPDTLRYLSREEDSTAKAHEAGTDSPFAALKSLMDM
jgi:uncharacterized protein